MSIQQQKKWVVAAFVIMALAMAAIFGFNAWRASKKSGGGAPTDRKTMQDVADQKELAAALKDPARRQAAIDSLKGKDSAVVGALLTALGHKSDDPEVRAAALTALGEVSSADDMRSVQALTIGVRDTDARVRTAAIAALGKLDTDEAANAVVGALNDIDVAVRIAAGETLAAGKGHTVTIEPLTRSLAEEESAEVRRVAALALGRIEDEAARAGLIRAQGTELEATVRLALVEALGAWDDDFRVKGVVCGMCDSDEKVRAKAKEFFAELDQDALPYLEAALTSSEFRKALGRQGRGVMSDITEAVAAMKTPAAAGSLIHALDISVGTDEKARYPKVRDRAVAELASLGAPAVKSLADSVLKPTTRLALKKSIAATLAKVGAGSVPAIEAYVKSRKILPSSVEARLWTETLEQIGGAAATKAIAGVKAHDPNEVFKKFAALATPPHTERPPAPQLEEFALALHGGVYSGNPPNTFARRKSNLPFVTQKKKQTVAIQKYSPKSRCSVMLDLTRTKDGWDRIVGHPGSYYNSTTFGKIDQLDITETEMKGKIRVTVGRDPWMMGGYGEYDLALTRQNDGSYRGTYKGNYRDVAIEGIATCTRKPKRRPLRAGWKPVQPGERPRLLFRRDDLPRIKARLNTPFGKAAFRKFATAKYIVRHETASAVHAALGLLYQLTGDKSYAMQAIPMVEREMADRDFGFMGLGQVWGGRFMNVALAYDMCYDAWPPEFVSKVNTYLINGSYATSTKMSQFSSCANTHPCSNYFSPIVGGGSYLALAYWMDRGPAPAMPGGLKLLQPALLKGAPPDGVPVTTIKGNGGLAQWLWSGLIFLPTSPDELIEVLGDTKKAPIQEGRKIKLGQEEFSFHLPGPDVQRRDGIYPWSVISEQKPGCSGAAMLMHGVLKCARPGYYSLHLPAQGSSMCVVGDVTIPSGAYVELKEGLYPVVFAFTGDSATIVSVAVRLRWITDDRKEIDILMKEAAGRLKSEKLLYELDTAEHKATGMDGKKIGIFNMTRCHMYRSHRLLMGSGGFNSEGETYHHTAIDPVRYGGALWNVFGQMLSAYPDYNHGVARFIGQSVLYEHEGRLPSLTGQSYNGGGSAGHFGHWIAIGFPYAPEEYKPAMLWMWHRLKGVKENDPESCANIIHHDGLLQSIYAFVNYPLDPKTGTSRMKPVHPNESFTKTYRAVDKGLYVFRNQIKNQQDIVLQVYANELMSKGHGQPDAAGLRLHGLGYDWTPNSPGKGTPFRWLQNVVVIPPDTGMKRATGKVTSWHGEEDGSGRVSLNMDMVYAGKRGHDSVGTWPADLPEQGDVTGLRAVAADYSGKCGAPALFVLVDKVDGGEEERAWLWNMPGEKSASGDLAVAAKNNTFTVKQGKASLRGFFVTPAGVTVEKGGKIMIRDTSTKEAAAAKKKDKKYKPEPAPWAVPILARAKPGQHFFVVMTMQEGPPPEVKVKGEGLKAVVCVGKRQITFDGKNAIIADL